MDKEAAGDAFDPDAERLQTFRERPGIRAERPAGDLRIARMQCGEKKRTVQDALGSRRFDRDVSAKFQLFHAKVHTHEIIRLFRKKVKTSRFLLRFLSFALAFFVRFCYTVWRKAEMMEYRVVRSKRRSYSLSVDRGGGLVVRAPLSARGEEIAAFVERHRAWAERRLACRAARPRFADGEEIVLCGKKYIIAEGRTGISGETLHLPAENREAALIPLLREMTRARMRPILDGLCRAYGFSYTKLAVTSARGRWGSCGSNGHISFSFRSAFLPDDLAFYLAVHELCHTRHMDHSAAFWREVGKVIPDYSARRKALKRYLWAMDCL